MRLCLTPRLFSENFRKHFLPSRGETCLFSMTPLVCWRWTLDIDRPGAIAEAMGPKLDEERYLSVIFPPLLHKWNSIDDDDTDLFPLLDCFQHVAMALGLSFLPYTPQVFSRFVVTTRRSYVRSDASS